MITLWHKSIQAEVVKKIDLKKFQRVVLDCKLNRAIDVLIIGF